MLIRISPATPLAPQNLALTDVDHDTTPNHIQPFLCFETTAAVDRYAIADRLATALSHSVSNMPVLAGSLHFDPWNTLYVRIASADRLDFHVCDLTDDPSVPSYADLAAKRFFPSALDSTKLCPVDQMHYVDLAAPGQPIRAGSPVAYVQLSFIQGGIILAPCLYHRVADGVSLHQWLRTLASYARSAPSLPTSCPAAATFDRSWNTSHPLDDASFAAAQSAIGTWTVVPSDSPLSGFYAEKFLSPIVGANLIFSASTLAQLKKDCAPPGGYVSTFDVATAAFWAASVRARAQDPRFAAETHSTYFYPINLRFRSDAVPMTYVGNAYSMGAAGPLPKEAFSGPNALALAAQTIREDVATGGMERRNLELSLKIEAKARGMRLDNRMRLSQGLDGLGTSWAFMALDEYDFGFGECQAVRLSGVPWNGLFLLWPGKPGASHVCASMFMEASLMERMKVDEELQKVAEIQAV